MSVFFELHGTLVNLGTMSYMQKEDAFDSPSIVMFWPGDSEIHQTHKEFIFNNEDERDRVYSNMIRKMHADNAYACENV